MIRRLLPVILAILAPRLFGDRDSWLGSTYTVKLSLSMAQSGDSHIPRPKRISTPEYPSDMMMTTIDGEVTIEFTVTANGSVKDLSILKSDGEDFERSVRTSAKTWQFDPPLDAKTRRAVAVKMRCTIVFSCPENNSPNRVAGSD